MSRSNGVLTQMYEPSVRVLPVGMNVNGDILHMLEYSERDVAINPHIRSLTSKL